MVTRFESEFDPDWYTWEKKGTRPENDPPVITIDGGNGTGTSDGDGGHFIDVTMTAHGFSNFEVIGWNGSTFVKAQASLTGVEGLGIAVNCKTNSFRLLLGGLWYYKSHGQATGKNYLSPDTAGALTTTVPVLGEKVQTPIFVFNGDWFYVNTMGESLP